MTVHAVRAVMVDGGSVDLLLFFSRRDAEQHVEYIEKNCKLLGYDRLEIAERKIVGCADTAVAVAIPTTERRTRRRYLLPYEMQSLVIEGAA